MTHERLLLTLQLTIITFVSSDNVRGGVKAMIETFKNIFKMKRTLLLAEYGGKMRHITPIFFCTGRPKGLGKVLLGDFRCS